MQPPNANLPDDSTHSSYYYGIASPSRGPWPGGAVWFERRNTGLPVWHILRDGRSMCGETAPFPGMPRARKPRHGMRCPECMKRAVRAVQPRQKALVHLCLEGGKSPRWAFTANPPSGDYWKDSRFWGWE